MHTFQLTRYGAVRTDYRFSPFSVFTLYNCIFPLFLMRPSPFQRMIMCSLNDFYIVIDTPLFLYFPFLPSSEVCFVLFLPSFQCFILLHFFLKSIRLELLAMCNSITLTLNMHNFYFYLSVILQILIGFLFDPKQFTSYLATPLV